MPAKKAQKTNQEVAEMIADPEQRTKVFKAAFTIGDEVKKGNFTAKIPGVMQRARMGVQRAKMSDGVNPENLDSVTDDIIFVVSYLETMLIERPAWFDWELVEDFEELLALYTEVTQWVNAFRGRNKNSANEGNRVIANSEDDLEGYEAL